METVKRFFGVVMLALAVWIVSPLLSVSVQMGLWGVLLILSAMMLKVLETPPPHAGSGRTFARGLGVLALLLGAAYLVGALSGARDILRPLGALGRAEVEAPRSLAFERVHSLAELDARIAAAQGRPVMLDFYADWCVSCKEMERFTFSDDRVQAHLHNVVLLQADVTANNEDDKALLKRYTLFGPPATLFFDAQGKELSDYRVTGFQNAEQFLSSLKAAGL
jgi:thiol:disulfide interchange protein DsbD